jgi:CBS domain-containing protein
MRNVRHLLQAKGCEVFAIEPGARVIDAVRLMAERHIGAVVVLDGDRLAGICSERDYARKVVLQGRSSSDTAVHEIMTPEVITVRPEDTVEHCMQIVTRRRVRHLPVVEGTRVVGIVSIGDLVKAVIEDQQAELDQLQHYVQHA